MRAILTATGYSGPGQPSAQGWLPPLVPFLGRPFIEHVLTFLQRHGFTAVDLILCHGAHRFEELLGNGDRWGMTLRHHLARDAARPYARLDSLDLDADADILLLGCGHCLPRADISRLRPMSGRTAPVMLTDEPGDADGSPRWSGWSWVPASRLCQVAPDATEEDVGRLLTQEAMSHPTGREPEPCGLCLSSATYRSYLSSVKAVLAKRFPEFVFPVPEREDGLWISDSADLSPNILLRPPLFVGPSSRVEAEVCIGPHVAVENGCVLGKGSFLRDCVVLPGSSVGTGLELRESIVSGDRLINARVGVDVPVAGFVLNSVSVNGPHLGRPAVLSRLTAILLLLTCWPAIALTALYLKVAGHGPLTQRCTAVRLPAPRKRFHWQMFTWLRLTGRCGGGPGRPKVWEWFGDLLLRVLPGLLSVARGDLCMVGVPPRDAEEIDCLAQDWRELYLLSKAGLITETDVVCRAGATEDEQYAAEAVYAVRSNWRYDASILLRYALVPFRRCNWRRDRPPQD